MKIRNINVSEDLIIKISDLNIQLFVLDVIRPLEKELYSIENEGLGLYYKYDRYDYLNRLLKEHIRIFSLDHYDSIATLVHTIPIYLKDKGMPLEEYRELEGENCIDLLGAYFQNIRQNNESNPYIELYVDRIYDSANKDDKKFKWLFAITLIHELAHAVLDILNLEITTPYVNKISYNTDFGRWREESMANAIALRIIRDYGKLRFYDYARNFMLSQPAEYALGVLMEDFGNIYSDMRIVMDNKYKGVDQTLQDQWLDYVNGNPDWQGLKKWNEILSKQYIYLYKNSFYTDERELVYVFLLDYLRQYEDKNGKKMSVDIFRKTFQYIRTGAEMSYEPFSTVKSDSRYSNTFDLEDDTYSLYYFFDNRTMIKFFENTNFKSLVTVYQNY